MSTSGCPRHLSRRALLAKAAQLGTLAGTLSVWSALLGKAVVGADALSRPQPGAVTFSLDYQEGPL